ncbi:MAG: hypothetical protein HOV81_31255 [Kofleriaceae bacterium]|nr:hypothetical protein [Kofleriaceae bacterium]
MRLAILVALSACVEPPPAQWTYVHAAIIVPHCTTSACHSTLSRAGNLDLHDVDAAYQALTSRACTDTAAPAAGYVDTANPSASYLSILLRREGPTGMPPNARLADTEIERLETWMMAGARCD